MVTIDIESPPLTGPWIVPVPDDLAAQLVPARWIVHEWVDYWYVDHEATGVSIGSKPAEQHPTAMGHFKIRFENQLGLATIRTFDASGQRAGILSGLRVAAGREHRQTEVGSD